MYEQLGSFVSRRWVLVIVAWVAVAVGLSPKVQRHFGIHFTPTWDEITKDGDLAYLPDRLTSVRGQKLYGEAFPENKSRSEIVVVLEREAGLDQADLDLAHEIGDYFDSEKAKVADLAVKGEPRPLNVLCVVDVMRPSRDLEGKLSADDLIGQKLISLDRKALIVVASLEHELIAIDSAWAIGAVQTAVKERAAQAERRAESPIRPGLAWGISGSAAVGGDTLVASDKSIKNIHLATGVLVLFILLAVYRAPVVVFVPLLTIGVAVFIAKHVVALMTQIQYIPGFQWFHFEIFKTSEIFIFTILFGSGTDFCLFLISRYREEMESGLDKAEAMREALGQVGHALTGSAMTTVCGLGMMFFADFGKFTYSGPAIAVCLVIALLACLSFAPALMRGCGRLVFWPFGVKIKEHPVDADALPHADNTLVGRFWTWTSERIMARPGLILVAALLVMTPFAYAGTDVKISYDLMADLPRDSVSVQGTKMLLRHFPAGETGPISFFVKRDGADFASDPGRDAIRDLTKGLYALLPDEIRSVRSLTAPLGDPPKSRGIFGATGTIIAQRMKAAESRFVATQGPWAGQVTRFDVITAYDPFSPDAEAVLAKLEAFAENLKTDPKSPWYGATFDFIGTTAGTRDLKVVITSDEKLIQRLVVLSVFAVIISILRRPLICLYLIFTVVFSYLATIGATELLFAWLYGSDFTGLDWKVPIFLFVILVAVGEDYNIYLATRVFEEERRWGREKGLRAAIVKTGGIITSCGVIMAGTFVSLMTGSLVAMHALGFALTLGVILDTFIVRPVLVPAFLAWLYRIMPEAAEETVSPVPVPVDASTDGLAAGALLGEPMTIPAKPHAEMARRTVSR